MPQGAALKGWEWWQTEPGAASRPAGRGPGREGVATGKVWPELREPAAGRKESPGGPTLGRRQKARALGRTAPASRDPEMSFRPEGQALSPITRGSGPWLSHSSLCLRACGNQLLSPGSVRFWVGPLPLPPSLTSALHGMQTRSEAGSMGLAFIQPALLRAHWVPGSVPALRAKCYQCIEARPPVFLLCLPFGPLGALCH